MAHVMKPGANVHGPFSNATFIPTMTHGWVHANTWYASAPFNAAPPPVPAGVNPQTWMNGQWQPNPMFRPQPGMTQTSVSMWAPHPGWGAAVAQAHNPFKRIPNPGDASYWATKLSDNPLGLENMHIRDDTPATERHMKDMSNGVHHTPWVWAPKDLAKEGSAPPASNGTAGAGQLARQMQPQQSEKGLPPPPQSFIPPPQPVIPPPTQPVIPPPPQPVIPPPPQPVIPPPPQPPPQSSRDHVRSNSNSRTAYDSSAYDQSRFNDRPVPTSTQATMSSYSSFQQQQQQRQQPESQRSQERPQMTSQYQQASQYQQYQQPPETPQRHVRQRSRDVSPRPPTGERPQPSQLSQSYPSSHYRSHTTSSASSSASAAAAAVTASRSATVPTPSSRDRQTDRDREAFSAQREMHLTFSPNIVRTPDHYSSPPSRGTNYDDVERTPSRTPVPPHGNIYGSSSATPSRSNSIRRKTPGPSSSTPSSTSTSSSTTSTESSSLGLLMFTEEPQGLLSPLVVGGTPPAEKTSPGREISRSQPNVYTIPEEQQRRSYTRTPRSFERTPSRGQDSGRDWDQRDRERDREDRERERDWDRRDRERERDVNCTPQPVNRTPPSRTPPSSYYTRPSPESGSGSHHARQISRSHTLPMAASPSSASPRHSSPYSQTQQQYSSSATYPSSYPRTSPNSKPTHSQSQSRAASPMRHNPLPRPPAHSAYTESFSNRGSSSASAAAAVHQQQQQTTSRRQQMRHGYWNRRGDHLYVTDKGERFIVYAPHHLANPEELKHYPSPTEGWMDHRRQFMKYDPSVPELLDSLPLQGRSPVRPYSSFVHLVDV